MTYYLLIHLDMDLIRPGTSHTQMDQFMGQKDITLTLKLDLSIEA